MLSYTTLGGYRILKSSNHSANAPEYRGCKGQLRFFPCSARYALPVQVPLAHALKTLALLGSAKMRCKSPFPLACLSRACLFLPCSCLTLSLSLSFHLSCCGLLALEKRRPLIFFGAIVSRAGYADGNVRVCSGACDRIHVDNGVGLASAMGVYIYMCVCMCTCNEQCGADGRQASASAVASHSSAVAAVVAVGANLVHVGEALAAAAAARQGSGRTEATARGRRRRRRRAVGGIRRGARGAVLGLQRVGGRAMGSVCLQLQHARGIRRGRHEGRRHGSVGQQRVGGV